MTDRQIKLTRRRLLAGATTVGAAGVGAGFGTSALFSDEESFTNNSITAGSLDMTVTATQVANSGYPYTDNVGLSATTEDEPAVKLVAEDVKPGDWVIYGFEIAIEDNPGYVTIHADNLVETDVEETEPEADADPGVGTTANLGQYLHVTHWRAFGDSEPSDLDDRFRLWGLDNTTNTNNEIYSQGYGQPNEDGLADLAGAASDVEFTNLREFIETYDWDEPGEDDGSSGVLIHDSDNEEPKLVGGSESGNGPGTYEYYMLIELPESVGNEPQGDRVEFDLGWTTEQTRHNDEPRSESPFVDNGS